jgi:UDP-GlcNAc3NAcA epimerase
MTKKILTIIGARPQFIKAAAVSRVIKDFGGKIQEYIVHTGQHYDYNMSDVFFEELKIPKPDKNLHVGSGNHGQQTGEMLKLIEQELVAVKPDMMLVYGDTNSTLAGALAAVKLQIPIAHVEAGLRSFNRAMPEEINRVLTDHISALLFAPTDTAVKNLAAEGIVGEKVALVGDVMYDAIRFYESPSETKRGVLKVLHNESNPYIFATIHRAENTNDAARLLSIFNQLDTVSRDIEIILPLHPRTKSFLEKINFKSASNNLHIIEPQGYLDTLFLQKNSRLVVTDSGGVQKEAFLNHKYCVTVRPETEWIELVNEGFNFLANPIDMLGPLVQKLLKKEFPRDSQFKPYGAGDASERIIKSILTYLS